MHLPVGLKFDWQTVVDIRRNSKSLELWDDNKQQIAEIIRYDASNLLKVNTFSNELDVSVLEKMIALAREHLGDFEDVTPIHKAKRSSDILP